MKPKNKQTSIICKNCKKWIVYENELCWLCYLDYENRKKEKANGHRE